jgi:hypothetical protein
LDEFVSSLQAVLLESPQADAESEQRKIAKVHGAATVQLEGGVMVMLTMWLVAGGICAWHPTTTAARARERTNFRIESPLLKHDP